MNMTTKRPLFCIVGAVGVPAKYGGFETLAENLAVFHDENDLDCDLSIFCSARYYPDKQSNFRSAKLDYLSFDANGAQSVIYDGLSLWRSMRSNADTVLLLGVSGAVFLPFLRAVTSIKIVTNIDGIEWRRDKWKGFRKWFLWASEAMAVRFSHEIISDNAEIGRYIQRRYGKASLVIAYGGDHAILDVPVAATGISLPDSYAFGLCRIEPENNVEMILRAFTSTGELPLVFVGNWNKSTYGQELRGKYGHLPNIHLLDPIYDINILYTLRSKSALYLHGHSAGGTNPSLVEVMHFGIPIIAFDCGFNRETTECRAKYFSNSQEIQQLVRECISENVAGVGEAMKEIAERRYTWDKIAKEYFVHMQVGRKRPHKESIHPDDAKPY